MNKITPPTLDEWVELMNFEDLRTQWNCHAQQYTDDPEALVRLFFISLRQELTEGSPPSRKHVK